MSEVRALGEIDACGLAEARRLLGVVEADAHAVGARDAVGLGPDLAQMAAEFLARVGPGFDRERHADLVCADAVFGHGDFDFDRAVPGERGHGLAGGDDLARFGVERGDHAGVVGAQTRVFGLILRNRERSLRLLHLRLRRFQRIRLRVDLGLAHIIFGEQALIAVVVRLGQIARRLRRGEVRASAADLQLQVDRIELGDHLAGVDMVADVELARLDLAVDAEAELAFEARAYIAGVDLGIDRVGRLGMGDNGVARCGGNSRMAAAAGEDERADEDKDRARGAGSDSEGSAKEGFGHGGKIPYWLTNTIAAGQIANPVESRKS